MRLFAAGSPESVTVADIAEEAAMTSAAVYYHYASKDDILLEGLRSFGDALVALVRHGQQGLVGSGGSIGLLPVQVLDWVDERPVPATVWFVTSAGVSLTVESVRRENRIELTRVLARAARGARPMGTAEAGVVATGLLALVETAAGSWLTGDATLHALGRARFRAETSALAERITGVPVTALPRVRGVRR